MSGLKSIFIIILLILQMGINITGSNSTETDSSTYENQSFKTMISDENNQGPQWPMQGYDIRHSCNCPYDTSMNNGGVLWTFELPVPCSTGLAVGEDGTIYAGTGYFVDDSAGSLYAINPDGSLKWKCVIEGLSVLGPITISNEGMIYVGNTEEYFYAVNPNGTIAWKINIGERGRVLGSIIDSDGVIYVGGTAGYLSAIGGRHPHRG